MSNQPQFNSELDLNSILTNPLLHQLFAQTPVLIHILSGPEHTIQFFHPLGKELVGGRDLTGLKAREALPEYEGQGYFELLDKVYQTGETITINEMCSLLKNKEGALEERYFNTTYQPYKDSEGRIAGIFNTVVEVTNQVKARQRALDSAGKRVRLISTHQDITAQKETAAILKRQRAQFQNIVEGISDAFLSFDFDFRIIYANEKAAALSGSKVENIVGKTLWQVFPRLEGSPVYAFYHQTMQTRQPAQLAYFIPSACIWVEVRTFPTQEGVSVYATDITERKKAEDLLNYRRALLEAQNETIPDAILIVDTKGKILSYNLHFAELWKMPPEIINRKDDAAALEYAMTQLTDPEGFIKQVQYCYAHPEEAAQEEVWFKDGRVIERYGNAVVGEDGTNYGWAWYFRDITKQRKTDAAIKESEERFRTFADSITNLAWMADGEGWIYWYNQRWYDYTGSTLEEMQGWGWNKVHHPDHMDRVVKYVQKAWKGDEPFELTFPLKGKDGAFRWFLTRVVPVKDEAGKVIRWIGTNTDIHEQYLAEERFRTLAETLPLLVWMTNEKGVQEYASRQWMEYTGLDPMVPDSWQQTVHPQDMEGIIKTWSVSLATGEPYKAEVRLKSKAGEYRWYYVHGEPIKDEKGSISKWVGAFTDIDDQKENTQKLEALVQQRTRELHRSNEDLQQFAHVASHDLKEPVRKIRTFSGRLQQELGKELAESGKTYLSKIEAAATRMYSMIDGVLTYSTLSASEQKNEPVNLNELVGHIESDLEMAISQKKATLQYKDLPVVEGAPVLLHQLFYNLINNALKFSRADLSPLITITAKIVEQGEAGETGLVPAYSYCQIVVKDNGIGFSPEYADKIFHTFTRLHAKDKYEGTGLGLALCKKIVERYGGTITATGVEGEGATFTIYLPLPSAD